MKVLLISPMPGVDPACGDVTYTETLLANPPNGVQYESYTSAIKRGALREHGGRASLRRAVRARRGILKEIMLTAIAYILARARRAHLLFWEPFRLFSVEPGEYDAIHLHTFSARFFNLPCALVVSNAAPLRCLYRIGRGYSELRTSVMERIDIALGCLLRMNVNSYSLPQASRFIAFTSFLRDWYLDHRIMDADQIDVVPIYLPQPQPSAGSAKPSRVGFVAKEFAAKGGRVLLAAFKIVLRSRPDAELTIVGSPCELSSETLVEDRITWLPYIPRETLIGDVLPSFDVFAYPTEFDGLPLVVLEAMSLGIPIATSDYQAMPEILGDGRAGLISPIRDVERLAENILELLKPEVNAKFREAAYAFFNGNFDADVIRPRLRASYESAVEAWQRADVDRSHRASRKYSIFVNRSRKKNPGVETPKA